MRLIIDVSSTMDTPLTGVGWRTVYLIQEFLKINQSFEVCLFAARSRKTPRSAFPFKQGFSKAVILPYFRRAKVFLWPILNFPPIEWFCGKAEIAHGTFHDLPPTNKASRAVTIHDLSFLLFPETHTQKTISVQTRLLKHAIKYADAFEAVSESCKSELIDICKIPAEKIFVVPNGICFEEIEFPIDLSELNSLKRKFNITREYFIHLGTIEPRKNLPRLLKAYARIRQRYREYPQLVLVGTKGWKFEDTFQTAAQLNLNEDIIFCDYLPRKQALVLLRNAAACIYPSLYEGFGLPVLEAMAARVPVIASTANAIREISGGYCIFVDPTNVESIEAGLDQFLTNREKAQKNVENAYAHARRFTWTASAQKLSQMYTTLAEQTKKH